MNLQLYVDDHDDLQRCRQSARIKSPITIDGADPLTGRVKSYSGIVISIEQACGGLGERWRVVFDPKLTGVSRPESGFEIQAA